MNPLLETARAAADAAAAIHQRDLGHSDLGDATEKARSDYVSQTDLDAQHAALTIIQARHPDHQILAEESDVPVEDRLAKWDGGPLWIVDPLDGTSNYLHGHPMYAASVAVAVDGRPFAGAVTCGSTNERWWACSGEGAFKDGAPIHVSSDRPMADALIGTGFPFKAIDLLPTYLEQLGRVLRSASGVRRGGSAALDLCYLAQGSLDAFWEEHLMPWDFAAGIVLVEEAGGVMASGEGGPLNLRPGTVRGANGPELLRLMEAVLRAEGVLGSG